MLSDQSLQQRATKLAWLQVRLSRPQSEPASTASFCTTLDTLSLSLRALQLTFDSSVTADILPVIFSLPNLELLTFDEFGSGVATIPEISWLPTFQSSFHPPPLRLLKARMSLEAAANILPALPHLRDLDLIYSSPADFAPSLFTTLAHCHTLHHLSLHLHPESYLPPDPITHFAAACPALRELLIHCGIKGRLPYLTPWPPGTVAAICAALPHLDKLRLEHSMHLDPATELPRIAAACPALRELRLSADAPLASLAPLPAPLFPRLEVLRLDTLLWARRPLRTDVLKPRLEDLAARHLPRLHTLGNFGPDAHDYDAVNLGVRGTPGLRLPGKRFMRAPRRLQSVGDAIFREIMGEETESRWTPARAGDDGVVSYRQWPTY